MNVEKWLKKNTQSLEGKTIVLTGATGSIGYELCRIILQLNANLIIATRNKEKAQNLIINLKNINNDYQILNLKLDISDYTSIDNFVSELQKHPKIDYLIQNTGVYHLPPSEKNGHEIHYMTNYLGVIYLLNKIDICMNKQSKIIIMGSLSYRFSEINFDDIEGKKVRNKTKLYGRTKRLLTYHYSYLRRTKESINSNIKYILVHPGVTKTNLFTHQGFRSIFWKIARPMMHIIFMNPKKASLSAIYAIFNDVNENEWIGPRGLMQVWGYPKKHKLQRSIANILYQDKIAQIAESQIKEVNNN